MKNILVTCVAVLLLLIITLGVVIGGSYISNKNKAETNYKKIDQLLFQKEGKNNIISSKKFYDSKQERATKRVIFKDEPKVEYQAYLQDDGIVIDPVFYDNKKYKTPEDTKHYYIGELGT